jgi:hypothetical protein
MSIGIIILICINALFLGFITTFFLCNPHNYTDFLQFIRVTYWIAPKLIFKDKLSKKKEKVRHVEGELTD